MPKTTTWILQQPDGPLFLDIDQPYLGRNLRPLAYFCPLCGVIWARREARLPDRNDWRLAFRYCENHPVAPFGLGPPGSVLLHEEEFFENLGAGILHREIRVLSIRADNIT